MKNEQNTVDARGTTQTQALEMLEKLINDGFSGDVEKLAIVLGRDTSEIEDILDGEENLDDDLWMKIRGIARERGIEIE